ncbi:LCP family protein [Nonomuraea longicatena]
MSTAAVLGWTLLSALAPGAAHLRAGWRRTGLVLLSLYAAGLLALLYLRLTADGDTLGSAVTQLTPIMIGVSVLGTAWFVLVVHSFVVLRPGRLSQRGQVLAGTLAGLLAVAVITPFGLVTQILWRSQEAFHNIFPEESGQAGAERPADPWNGRRRVNILLLGGDADGHRVGVRTDSMNVASIDLATGNTVLISLPRNLENVRFRPGTPMAARFPSGFRLPTDPGGGRSDLLNSVWEYSDAHPEIFGGRQRQGPQVLMDTIGHTLGLRIDWYALVNMWGFARLIDAIGGVTITVERDVVFGRHNEGLVKAGRRRLDGGDAMWYARSRTFSDDYTRMRRQRCVMAALLDQADPATVLTRFNGIALATKELIRTDIPHRMLRYLVPLALKVKNAEVTSVQFMPPLIHTGYPDWQKIRTITDRALKDSVKTRQVAASATPRRTPAAAPSRTATTTTTTTAAPDPSRSLTDGCGRSGGE